MSRDLGDSPEAVAVLAERCYTHVKHRLGFELDYENETLSVLDYFVKDVVQEEGGGETPPPGDHRRTHLIHLLAPSIGAYFGEVLVRTFACRWRLKTEDPRSWLLEFENVPLRFNPIGAAAEALAEEMIDSWSGALCTSPDEEEGLSGRLAAAPPIPEKEFFALTTRFEAIQIADDWLRSRQAIKNPPPPEFYSQEDYDRIFQN